MSSYMTVCWAHRKGITLETRENAEAAKYRERFFNFYDDRLMDGAWCGFQERETIEMFFRLLALCHTVVASGPPDPSTITYQVSVHSGVSWLAAGHNHTGGNAKTCSGTAYPALPREGLSAVYGFFCSLSFSMLV